MQYQTAELTAGGAEAAKLTQVTFDPGGPVLSSLTGTPPGQWWVRAGGVEWVSRLWLSDPLTPERYLIRLPQDRHHNRCGFVTVYNYSGREGESLHLMGDGEMWTEDLH